METFKPVMLWIFSILIELHYVFFLYIFSFPHEKNDHRVIYLKMYSWICEESIKGKILRIFRLFFLLVVVAVVNSALVW